MRLAVHGVHAPKSGAPRGLDVAHHRVEASGIATHLCWRAERLVSRIEPRHPGYLCTMRMGTTRSKYRTAIGSCLLAWLALTVAVPAPAGALQSRWVRQFGTLRADHVEDMSADGTALYVVGNSYDNVGGGYSNPRGFLRKYDLTGTLLWSLCDGCNETFTALDVEGNALYVTGKANVTGVAFVRRYDLSGRVVWSRQFDAPIDAVHAVGTSVYFAGSTFNEFPGETTAGGRDVFVAKFSAGGTRRWVHQFGTQGYDDAGAITATSSMLLIAGHTSGSFPGESNPQEGNADALVLGLSTTGQLLWADQFGTPGQDDASDVAVDDTGLYVAATLLDTSLPLNFDAVVRKYGFNGDLLWSNAPQTAENDFAFGIAASPRAVFVVGQTDAPGRGGYDALVKRYSTGGVLQSTLQVGTSGYDVAVRAQAKGLTVYMGGYTSGIFVGQAAAGNDDAFLAKVS